MFLKAGALSLALLLASRLLGLLRETAQAAAFGASGLADVAVLMLTLPDWITGVLASGAMAYVLLPAWAGRPPAEVAATQRRLTQGVLAGAVVLALALAVLRGPLAQLLAPGVPVGMRPWAADALLGAAAALPLALLAALWGTRLQHERDFAGLYGANLVVNLGLIAALAACAGVGDPRAAIALLAAGLLGAMGARLLWQKGRLRPFRTPPGDLAAAPLSLPLAGLWAWAILAAGLPLALPFVARSLASAGGEGALVTFNYAWKLVELPLQLAIQLVATLAFAPIAAALARGVPRDEANAAAAIRPAMGLAWTLACAAAAALLWAAPAVADLLFHWGRMEAAAVARVAAWGATGAWSLPPQALTAVAGVVLAAQGRLGPLVLAHGAALAGLLLLGPRWAHDGHALMLLLDVLTTGVAVAALLALGPGVRRWMPWPALAAAGGVLALQALLAWFVGQPAGYAPQWAGGAAGGLAVVLSAALASADVRKALRR
jgi:putative peptidoglycan lipid II flippase